MRWLSHLSRRNDCTVVQVQLLHVPLAKGHDGYLLKSDEDLRIDRARLSSTLGQCCPPHPVYQSQ